MKRINFNNIKEIIIIIIIIIFINKLLTQKVSFIHLKRKLTFE